MCKHAHIHHSNTLIAKGPTLRNANPAIIHVNRFDYNAAIAAVGEHVCVDASASVRIANTRTACADEGTRPKYAQAQRCCATMRRTSKLPKRFGRSAKQNAATQTKTTVQSLYKQRHAFVRVARPAKDSEHNIMLSTNIDVNSGRVATWLRLRV